MFQKGNFWNLNLDHQSHNQQFANQEPMDKDDSNFYGSNYKIFEATQKGVPKYEKALDIVENNLKLAHGQILSLNIAYRALVKKEKEAKMSNKVIRTLSISQYSYVD